MIDISSQYYSETSNQLSSLIYASAYDYSGGSTNVAEMAVSTLSGFQFSSGFYEFYILVTSAELEDSIPDSLTPNFIFSEYFYDDCFKIYDYTNFVETCPEFLGENFGFVIGGDIVCGNGEENPCPDKPKVTIFRCHRENEPAGCRASNTDLLCSIFIQSRKINGWEYDIHFNGCGEKIMD